MYREYAPSLYKLVYRLVGNRQDAEDVTQDVWNDLPCKAQKYECGRRLKPWLREIFKNAALDHLKRHKRRKEDPIEGCSGPEMAAHGSIETQVDFRNRMRMIEKLSNREQKLIYLRHIEDLTPSEAAEILGMKVASFNASLSRALKHLRELDAEDN